MAYQGPSTRSQVSFNGGEWSPVMHDRIDLEKFTSACRTQRNLFPSPYGPTERRAGTKFVAGSKSDTKVRLIEFIFSTTTTYVIELGNLYMRFYTSRAQLTSGSSIVEIATHWTTDQLFDIDFNGDDDLMYFVHPDVPPQKLTRTSATAFTLEEVPWVTPPLLDENEGTTTLACSATTGTGRTLTASASTFESGHVGTYFQIRHKRDANYVEITATGSTSSLLVQGDWRLEVYSTSSLVGEILVEQLSQDGATWETVTAVKLNNDADSAIRTGTQDKDKQMRLSVTFTSGTGRAYFENVAAFSSGLVKVTAVAGPTSATVDVVDALYSTDATPYWSEGAFSDVRGYPRTLCIFENRLWFGGTSHEPQTYYGSKIDDYDDFPVGTLDTDRVKFKLGGTQSNAIQWMIGSQELLIGTTGEEFRISTGDSYQPLTPSTIPRQLSQSNNGSEGVQCEIVGSIVIFLQRGGRKVREFSFSYEINQYKTPDLIILSEHLSKAGITCMAYQRDPHSILWAVTGDGLLIGMSYEREQLLNGWFAYETDGLFESVAVIPSADGDEVWVSVKRTVNGATKRFVEYFDPVEWESQEDGYYVDCGVTYDGSETSVFSGLDHLIGETVQVCGDGAYLGSYVVDENGEVDIGSNVASVAHIGLGFVSTFKPMKFDIDSKAGNSQGQKKIIHGLDIGFRSTVGAKVKDEDGAEIPIPWRDFADYTGTAIPLFTGNIQVPFTGKTSYDPYFEIVQDLPLPMTIQNVTTRYEITQPDD